MLRESQFAEKNEQRKQKELEKDQDYFKWLNLKTKFDQLKKKIKFELINTLNEVNKKIILEIYFKIGK